VKNSDKTYGELMIEAKKKNDHQEIGDVSGYLCHRFKERIDEWVNLQSEKGKFYKKYYIWVRLRKEPYAPNAIHILPQLRLTRPSPYQDTCHILWSVTDMNRVDFEWNVMDASHRKYVLDNKTMFHEQTVGMAQAYKKDKLEKIDDYLVGDQIL
jgi:hypothetical protein